MTVPQVWFFGNLRRETTVPPPCQLKGTKLLVSTANEYVCTHDALLYIPEYFLAMGAESQTVTLSIN